MLIKAEKNMMVGNTENAKIAMPLLTTKSLTVVNPPLALSWPTSTYMFTRLPNTKAAPSWALPSIAMIISLHLENIQMPGLVLSINIANVTCRLKPQATVRQLMFLRLAKTSHLPIGDDKEMISASIIWEHKRKTSNHTPHVIPYKPEPHRGGMELDIKLH